MNLLSRIFTKVENPPPFLGGAEAWNSYIQDICYRNKRLIRKEGPARIAVQFIVDNLSGTEMDALENERST